MNSKVKKQLPKILACIGMIASATTTSAAPGSPGTLSGHSGNYWTHVSVTNSADTGALATRRYNLYVPPNVTSSDSVALVIIMHGGNSDYDKVLPPPSPAGSPGYPSTIWANVADESTGTGSTKKVILAIPNGVNDSNGNTNGNAQHWNDCSGYNTYGSSSTPHDTNFISAMVSDINTYKSTYGFGSIDTNWVFISGVSNGGNMTLRLAREMPTLASSYPIAAIGVSAAGDAGNADAQGNYSSVADVCSDAGQVATTKVPALLIKGDSDNYLDYDGGCTYPDTTCWLPWDGTVTQTGWSSAPNTLSRWRTKMAASSGPTSVTLPTDTAIYNPNAAPGNADSSTISCNKYTGSTSASDVYNCIAVNNGHTDPSIAVITSSLFGNQNRDLEAARYEWLFFQNHHLPH